MTDSAQEIIARSLCMAGEDGIGCQCDKACETCLVVSENAIEALSSAGLVIVGAKELLAIRDALIANDLDDAYHHLYAIACPDFCEFEPWEKLEAMLSEGEGG